MQRLPPRDANLRSTTIQHTKSFTRYEPAEATESSNQTRTASLSDSKKLETTPISPLDPLGVGAPESGKDIFNRQQEDDGESEKEDLDGTSFPEGFDDLPVEIQSLTERFLEGLTAKVHSAPLSIQRLSELYQGFYEHAQTHINTHIAALSTRLSREQSPNPSTASFGSESSSKGTIRRPLRALSSKSVASDGGTSEQQMLTASEITDKRKAKKQLEVKRVAIEEAVERGLCTKVYPRLWRHRSTDDEAKDEKLRSRAAALSVVGIGLKELLSAPLSEETGSKLASDVENGPASPHLKEARENIKAMNDDRYPLAKLNHLTATHKNVVDALQQLFPSTSSADEVLPTLIYIIITSPPESLHVISNLHFIQRFRASGKVTGEAAYCLTNLEAAISFIENVDLSTLGRSEALNGPVKSSSSSSTPLKEKSDPLYRGLSEDGKASSSSNDAKLAPLGHARRLSNLINRPKTFDAASDAVINTAQPAIDSIQSALDGSFKYLFGRLREKQATSDNNNGTLEVVAPKTLEDARKLVSPIEAPDEDPLEPSDNGSIHDSSTGGEAEIPTAQDNNSRLLDLVGGKRGSTYNRDRSLSNSSGNKPENSKDSTKSDQVVTAQLQSTTATSASGFAAVESMRNLSNSFNPLKNLTSGMGMMRGFGARAAATPPPSVTPPISAPPQPVATSTPPTIDISEVAPALKRFVELKEPKELNFYDIELLLRDYQRLAGALRAAGGTAPV